MRSNAVLASHIIYSFHFPIFPWFLCPWSLLYYCYLSVFFHLFLSLYHLSGISGSLIWNLTQVLNTGSFYGCLYFPEGKRNHLYTQVEIVLQWDGKGSCTLSSLSLSFPLAITPEALILSEGGGWFLHSDLLLWRVS